MADKNNFSDGMDFLEKHQKGITAYVVGTLIAVIFLSLFDPMAGVGFAILSLAFSGILYFIVLFMDQAIS